MLDCIKKVSGDIEAMKFNTAIAALMALVNEFSSKGCTRGDIKTLLLMLSPFAPHMVEELWENLDENNKISLFVRYTDLATGEYQQVIRNKF